MRVLSFLQVRDPDGTISWEHTLSIPALVLIMVKWLLGGFELKIAGQAVMVPVTSATDAAIMCGVWLAYLGANQINDARIRRPAEEKR